MLPPQIPLGIALAEAHTFDNYVSGANAEAVAHLRALNTRSVLLWGASGTGKTHLLHAILHAAAQQDATAAYVPLREVAPMSAQLLDGYEESSIVCIDDVDAIAGNAEWEEALFHLYNRCNQRGHTFVSTTREAPATLPIALADLRSRLTWGLVLQLTALTESDRIAALQQRARGRGFVLPDDVAHYLLRHCPRDTASLFALLDRLDQATLIAQRKLTIPFVRGLIL